MHSSDSTMALADLACPRTKHSYESVQRWLVEVFANLARLDQEDIDVDRAFVDFQLDSSVAVTLARRLGDWADVALEPTIFWEYPNIRELALALAADGVEEARNGSS